MNNGMLWAMQILLAIWFGFGAYKKLTTPVEKMITNKSLPFGGNPVPIIILGFLELLGAVGIIVPQALNFCTSLTTLTAVCFSLVMLGAIFVHVKNKTYKILPVIVLALILSVTVAYYRFYLP